MSAGTHDAAAALVVDGRIVAAVEEERLSRRKHDGSFPERAADACLAIAGVDAASVDLVAWAEKPIEVVGRHLASRFRAGPRGLAQLFDATPRVVRDQLGVGSAVRRYFTRRDARTPRLVLSEHHMSHAASAFFPSPFRSAAVLTVDGVGEYATATIGDGHDHRLRLLRELRYPDSVGILYSAFTSYCGFGVNSGEGELMGLAPFGEPRFADLIRERLVDLAPDGSVRLDPRYFAHVGGRRTTGRRFHDLFGGEPRAPGSPPGRREADLAASVQVVVEEILVAMAEEARRITGYDDVCLAGGVALNCVANAALARRGPFERVWVQPAAGDGGTALGAALWAWHNVLGRPRAGDGAVTDAMRGSFLGPSFGSDEIAGWLRAARVAHRTLAPDDLRDEVARLIADGAVVGWFRGRMEFGPRALGNRSILADPRSSTVQGRLNRMIKERAAFRPFAPVVLEERAGEWFDEIGRSPYMTTVAQVASSRRVDGGASAGGDDDGGDDLAAIVARVRSSIPAVTHVDGSARVQTVDVATHPDLHALIASFDRLTSCPVLLNTSFNAAGEPIVCTPDDALDVHRRIGLDVLVLEDHLIDGAADPAVASS